MKIGIDFDNTIVNTFETSKKYLDKFLPDNNLKSYHDLPKEQEWYFVEHYFNDITKDLTLYDNVLNAIDFFKKNDIKVVLITARGGHYPEIIEETKKFIEKNNIPFDEIIFSVYPKGKEAKEHELDYVIDDSIDVVNDVRNHGVKALLYGDEVKNWQEVIEYFEKEVLCHE